MAKEKDAKVDKRAPPARTTEAEKEEKIEYKKAPIGDTPSMKGLLDDVTCQCLDEFGIPEDMRYSNLKLLIGFVAVGLALTAQFYPTPFKPLPYPAARPIYLVCVSSYFLLSGLLTALAVFHERETMVFTRACSKVNAALRINTDLPRFSSVYSVTILRKDNNKELCSREFDITGYFEEDGTFHENFFWDDLTATVLADLSKLKDKTM